MILKRVYENTEYSLPTGNNSICIGRSNNCDIIVNSKYVSRVHCKIYRIPPHGRLIIQNLSRTAKTYVNETELANSGNEAELSLNDCIGLGVPLKFMSEMHTNIEDYVFFKVCSVEITEVYNSQVNNVEACNQPLNNENLQEENFVDACERELPGIASNQEDINICNVNYGKVQSESKEEGCPKRKYENCEIEHNKKQKIEITSASTSKEEKVISAFYDIVNKEVIQQKKMCVVSVSKLSGSIIKQIKNGCTAFLNIDHELMSPNLKDSGKKSSHLNKSHTVDLHPVYSENLITNKANLPCTEKKSPICVDISNSDDESSIEVNRMDSSDNLDAALLIKKEKCAVDDKKCIECTKNVDGVCQICEKCKISTTKIKEENVFSPDKDTHSQTIIHNKGNFNNNTSLSEESKKNLISKKSDPETENNQSIKKEISENRFGIDENVLVKKEHDGKLHVVSENTSSISENFHVSVKQEFSSKNITGSNIKMNQGSSSTVLLIDLSNATDKNSHAISAETSIKYNSNSSSNLQTPGNVMSQLSGTSMNVNLLDNGIAIQSNVLQETNPKSACNSCSIPCHNSAVDHEMADNKGDSIPLNIVEVKKEGSKYIHQNIEDNSVQYFNNLSCSNKVSRNITLESKEIIKTEKDINCLDNFKKFVPFSNDSIDNCAISPDIAVKQEVIEKSNVSVKEESDYNYDDEIIYSQVDDVILISSDEEDNGELCTSTLAFESDTSFECPQSPDLDLQILFEEFNSVKEIKNEPVDADNNYVGTPELPLEFSGTESLSISESCIKTDKIKDSGNSENTTSEHCKSKAGSKEITVSDASGSNKLRKMEVCDPIPPPSSKRKSRTKNLDKSNDASKSIHKLLSKKEDKKSLDKKIRNKKDNTDIRKKLKKDYGLKINESSCKKRHHIVKNNRASPEKSIKDLNFSVQKKSSNDWNLVNIVAKNTAKSRNQKLFECDMFSSTSKSPANSAKQNIVKTKQHKNVSDHGKTKKCTDAINQKLHESDILASTSNTLKENTNSKQLKNSSDNRINEKSTKVNKKIGDSQDITNSAYSTVQNSVGLKKGEEKFSSNLIEIRRRGILKNLCATSSKKKVAFHSKNLEKIYPIPPRTQEEIASAKNNKQKETHPKIHSQQKFSDCNYEYEFISYVCKWNFDWLAQYKREIKKKGSHCATLPPLVPNKNLYPTLILYNSFNDYKEIFGNLVYFEVWESIYRDWLNLYATNQAQPYQVDFVKSANIIVENRNFKMHQMKLYTVIPEKFIKNAPKVGFLVSVKFKLDPKNVYIFGYIIHVDKKKRPVLPQELKDICPTGGICIGLDVISSKEVTTKIKGGSIVFLTSISYLKTEVRVWQSLNTLCNSPLFNDILLPNPLTFEINCKTEYIVNEMPLNIEQKDIVTTASAKCCFGREPKISLIHGPPGTGKTKTIISLIMQIIKLSDTDKHAIKSTPILMCAPSNASVDEITLRLMKLKEIGINITLVRTGQQKSMHPSVIDYSLDRLAERDANQVLIQNINELIQKFKNDSVKSEFARIEKGCSDAQENLKEIEKSRDPCKIKEAKSRLTGFRQKMETFMKNFINDISPQQKAAMIENHKIKILQKADVITTTLGGCKSGSMSLFLAKKNVRCCIVDEAGQCKETEMWLPLSMGVSKLVLVGDHQQLPATVLSQFAQGKSLHQSLFERLYHYFYTELNLPDNIHVLEKQYRMHNEILLWPSKHFYDSRVVTACGVTSKRNYLLKPYIFFDIEDSKENIDANGSVSNFTEIDLIVSILEVMSKMCLQGSNIGIITPYNNQKKLLEEKLLSFKEKLTLLVNTIDAFQGQERDIILFSTVRSNSNSALGFLNQHQRLNVALTRARRSCFIIGNSSSLSSSKDWKSLISNAVGRGVLYPIGPNDVNNKDLIRKLVLK